MVCIWYVYGMYMVCIWYVCVRAFCLAHLLAIYIACFGALYLAYIWRMFWHSSLHMSINDQYIVNRPSTINVRSKKHKNTEHNWTYHGTEHTMSLSWHLPTAPSLGIRRLVSLWQPWMSWGGQRNGVRLTHWIKSGKRAAMTHRDRTWTK